MSSFTGIRAQLWYLRGTAWNPFYTGFRLFILIVMELKVVEMTIPEESNIILGQSHFIKTVEDVYEALASSAAGIKFGLAFCEASGDCLVRFDGNDEELKQVAAENAMKLGC